MKNQDPVERIARALERIAAILENQSRCSCNAKSVLTEPLTYTERALLVRSLNGESHGGCETPKVSKLEALRALGDPDPKTFAKYATGVGHGPDLPDVPRYIVRAIQERMSQTASQQAERAREGNAKRARQATRAAATAQERKRNASGHRESNFPKKCP